MRYERAIRIQLLCLSVLALPRRNPKLAARITVLPRGPLRSALAALGVALLTLFLGVHLAKDLTAAVDAWYFRSTFLWLLVMLVATAIYLRQVARLRRQGVDLDRRFAELPPE